MAIPTKAPAPDKPGPLGLRLDHRTQEGPTVQTRLLNWRATLRATQDRAEVQVHSLPPERV